MSLTNYTSESVYQAAQAWLKRGCSLLPCQKNSKFFLPGFGPFRKVLTTDERARRYFLEGGFNLAVLLHGLFCLDFDNWSLFCTWSESVPGVAQNTYTEITPRGAHVFYRGDPPAGLRLKAGCEIKRACLVAPSTVAGRKYVDLGVPGFLAISDIQDPIFPLLSEEKLHPASEQATGQARDQGSGDLLDRIKAAFPITEIVSQYTELKPSGRVERRWLVGLCPFHVDHKPSLWVDIERNLWGCHACGIKGDVINFYAREHKLTLQGAIRELAGRLPRV